MMPGSEVVTVIGAGAAGLVAARELAQAGRTVRVIEAQDAPGGMIAPAQLGPVRIDIGAEAFAVRGGVVSELVEELGLGGDVVSPRTLGSWGYQDGEAYPQPAGGLLGIPAGPDAPGLAEAVGAAGVEAARREATLPAEIGADATNLAELVRARFGNRILQRLVAPVTRGVYSLEPEQVRVDALLPGVRARLAEVGSLSEVVRERRSNATPGALVRTVRGGMHRLMTALADECRRLGVEFVFGCRVAALAEFAGPVLVTVPPSDAFPYLGELRAPASVPTEVVALLVAAPALDAFPRGTGVLVAPGDGPTPVLAKALTHVTAKWPWVGEVLTEGHHVIRLSYPPAAIGSGVVQHLADAGAILGVELTEAQLLGHARHVWQMPAPPAATQTQTTALRERLAQLPPRIQATGTWIAGTGLASVLPHARAAALATQ